MRLYTEAASTLKLQHEAQQ